MTKIYYFSGTGNSLWSAKRIAEITDEPCELHNIGIEAQKKEIVIEADAVVLVFPSYAYGLPRIVGRFAKNAVFKTEYIASFVTYGSNYGGTLAAMRRILKRKKIKSCFFGGIPAVENYLAIFGPPKPKTVERRLAMQEKATEEAARCVIEKRTNRVNTFRPLSAYISLLFNLGIKFFYRFYRLTADCNACGLCEKICPVSAVYIKDSRPVFTKKCEHCQGCIDICPKRALVFGRVRAGSVGWRHPGYSAAE